MVNVSLFSQITGLVKQFEKYFFISTCYTVVTKMGSGAASSTD